MSTTRQDTESLRGQLTEIADQLAAIEIPRPTEDSGAYEFWRGYRQARNECVFVLRGLADSALDPPQTTLAAHDARALAPIEVVCAECRDRAAMEAKG
jgi:hypothetical protein